MHVLLERREASDGGGYSSCSLADTGDTHNMIAGLPYRSCYWLLYAR